MVRTCCELEMTKEKKKNGHIARAPTDWTLRHPAKKKTRLFFFLVTDRLFVNDNLRFLFFL